MIIGLLEAPHIKTKAEMKAYMDELRKPRERAPMKFTRISCKNKVYSTSGCQVCWYCKECGRGGCDNLLGIRQGDEVVTEECKLE